jgi:hypothetical protein
MADYTPRSLQIRLSFQAAHGALTRIYIICQWLPDSRKRLRRLQELSVLTRLIPRDTLLTVCYGFGELVPLLIVTDTQ